MEFKIDTKPNFILWKPLYGTLDEKLTAMLRNKWKEMAESSFHNLVLDLQLCLASEEKAIVELVEFHDAVYSSKHSLVCVEIQPSLLKNIKNAGAELTLNIAPTMQEAIDIISMEILERELFDEEA
ncbi:MAG: hypothetical protein JSS78_05020 [Bacteroidetes bacterium]|nr:hypothetical protein [Bacteroidota bacterium]